MAQPISTWPSTGKRIAKRGKSGTLHAMSWISLEPGVVVRDVPMLESESGWGMVVEITACACIDAETIWR